MSPDVQHFLTRFGSAVVAMAAIVITGLYFADWLLFIVPPVVCGVLGYLVSRNTAAFFGWALIGLVAGVGFYLAL